MHTAGVPKQISAVFPMVSSFQIRATRSPSTANRQVANLIEKLSLSAESLSIDIEIEETRSGVRSVSDPAYSAFARNLRARRENIEATIHSLKELPG
jgi:hypothetical protein